MADDSKDKPSGPQDQTLGSSKDVLFGWLVRRAAADLGLAEAIAASEAQRTEQIKRLEDTLLAKVQEFQSQPSDVVGPALAVAEVQELQTQIQMLMARLGTIESTAQQAGRVSESLRVELAALGRHVGDQQYRLEARYSGIENTAETVVAKVRKLEEQLSNQPQGVEHFESAIGELQGQVQNVAERMAHFESASPITMVAEFDAERARWMAAIDERTAARIRELGDEIREKLKTITNLKTDLEAGRSDTAVLGERVAEVERSVRQFSTEVKAEISAQRIALGSEQRRQQAGEKFLNELDQRLGERMSDLENAVQQKLPGIDAHFGELAALRAQSLALSERVAELGIRAENGAAQVVAQAQRAQTQEETLAARLDAMADQLHDQGLTNESRGLELGHLGSEVRELIERVSNMEIATQRSQIDGATEWQRAEQSAHRLAADLAALKAEFTEQLKTLTAQRPLIQGLEESIGLQCKELQNELGQTRSRVEARDEQYRELGGELQALAQRIAEADLFAHRVHALMINEGEQGAQLREGLRSEFDALRAQLNQAQSSDAVIRGIEENINLKIRELESRLAERMRLWDRREAEFGELTTQFLNLSQGGSRAATPLPAFPDPAPSVAIPVDINSLRARREEVIAAGSSLPTEKTATVAPAEFPADASPGGGMSGGNKEQLRQLQERISADIERARAELREKSGRWRARR